jgi:hypothetical protein
MYPPPYRHPLPDAVPLIGSHWFCAEGPVVRDMPHWSWIPEAPSPKQEGAREARPEGPARRGTCPRGAEPGKRGDLPPEDPSPEH